MSLLKEISPAAKAALKREWHPTRNEGIKFDDLPVKSTLKVWWLCSKNPKHEWQARFRNRTVEGYGCHYSRGFGLKLPRHGSDQLDKPTRLSLLNWDKSLKLFIRQ